MSKRFHIQIRKPIDQALIHARQAAAKNGVHLAGDENQGKFSGHGVEGHYSVSDGVMAVTIQRKPLIAPWHLVEARLKALFSEHTA